MKATLAPFAIALSLFAVACGDNGAGPHPDATTSHDGGTDASTAARAIVAAGDFSMGDPGVLSVVDPAAATATPRVAPAGSVGDDPMVRRFGDAIYVINRSDGDNITILDAHTYAFVDQLATGVGSNPQDVAVVGQKLYVPVFGGKGVAVLTRGSNAIATIDLSADDPDGVPNCTSIAPAGGKLFVACELLDASFAPRGPGKVYVIDPTTDGVVGSLTMQNKNPFGLFEPLPSGDLVIPTIDFSNNAGCVEQIATSGTPASAGCVVNNSDLGGYAARIEVQAGAAPTLWLAVSAYPNGALRAFDLTAKTLGSAQSAAAEIVGDVAACPDGSIVVSDTAKTTGGVRVYRGGHEVTTAPIDVGLAPSSSHGLVCY